MGRTAVRCLGLSAFCGALLLVLPGCGTTGTHPLPAYEAPIAKTEFQTVRTTAYTHTEADHLEYTNHNALGGELHAAGPAIHRAENAHGLMLGLEEQSDYRPAAYTSSGNLQPFSLDDSPPPAHARHVVRAQRLSKTAPTRGVAVAKAQPVRIGSAAADWARWPVGTTFRVLSTGQVYRVDDYGWALAGRNTIDLYMATTSDMNNWGARQEPIQVLSWGDALESLRLLRPHEDHKHIKRMVLELEGREQEAADLH